MRLLEREIRRDKNLDILYNLELFLEDDMHSTYKLRIIGRICKIKQLIINKLISRTLCTCCDSRSIEKDSFPL